jgi:neurotransmitter:Na+ symporter, NSS family
MNERSTVAAAEQTTSEGTIATREVWGSRLGFIMAAVGSAVGLGNMWRFSYVTAERGGAAFVLFYLLLTFLIGVPIMVAEFGLGRMTRLSPIGAFRRAGGRAWTPLGYLFVTAALVILSYYSVIAGWVTRYTLDAIRRPFPADTGAYFSSIASGAPAVVYHLLFMALAIFIVAGGVRRGIEFVSRIMMPALAVIVLGLAVWAATLPAAGAGYRFYLTPHFDELLSADTIAAAASQAFFSLSLGTGIMLTFASYLKRGTSLPGESTIIALSDFGVAFVAGLVVFPVIYALSLQHAVGESTVGALFISLPAAFQAMGGTGRIVGVLFFAALFIGAITSAVSILEVVTASVIDEWKIARTRAALLTGGTIALLGVLPASDIRMLGIMDAVASEVMVPIGALGLALLVGWGPPGRRLDEFAEGASPRVRALMGGWRWTLRLGVPPLLIIVLYQTIPGALRAIREFGS